MLIEEALCYDRWVRSSDTFARWCAVIQIVLMRVLRNTVTGRGLPGMYGDGWILSNIHRPPHGHFFRDRPKRILLHSTCDNPRFSGQYRLTRSYTQVILLVCHIRAAAVTRTCKYHVAFAASQSLVFAPCESSRSKSPPRTIESEINHGGPTASRLNSDHKSAGGTSDGTEVDHGDG